MAVVGMAVVGQGRLRKGGRLLPVFGGSGVAAVSKTVDRTTSTADTTLLTADRA